MNEAMNEQRTVDNDLHQILLGRRSSTISQPDINRLLRGQADEEDPLVSFSTGGDIFGEIAAAAAATEAHLSTRESAVRPKKDYVDGATRQTEDSRFMQTALLPAHQILDQYTPDAKERPDTLFDAIDADWVPKVSSDGQIFYYNNRTTDSAAELPSPSTSSNVSRHRRTDSGMGNSAITKYPSGSMSISSDPIASASTAASVTINSLSAPELNRTSLAASQEEILQNDIHPHHTGREESWQTLAAPEDSRATSMHSDESALDSNFTETVPLRQHPLDISTTPQKLSLAATKVSGNRDPFEKNMARLKVLDEVTMVSKNATLAQLKQECTDSLNELSQAIQRGAATSSNPTSKEAGADSFSRHLLEAAAKSVNNSTRRLLSATDIILDQAHSKRVSTASSKETSPRSSVGQRSDPHEATFELPALPQADFRPLAMKINATESKLLLTVRTLWGLLGTSALEERAFEAAGQAQLLSDVEVHAESINGQEMLKTRKDIDAKLRFDLLIQVGTLEGAVTAFVDEVEAFAKTKDNTIAKRDIVTRKRIYAEFRMSPSDFLLSLSVKAGALRGQGFSRKYGSLGKRIRPPSDTLSILHYPQSVRSSRPQPKIVPARPLSLSTVENLDTDRKALLNDLSGLRTLFSSLFGSHKAESISTSSILPTVISQGTQFMQRLGLFLIEVESIDFASRLDVQLDLESFAALTGETVSEIAAKGIFPATSSSSPSIDMYQSGLRRAAELLQQLSVVKFTLYAVSPAFLAAVQAFSTTGTTRNQAEVSDLPPPMQPASASPLASLVTNGADTSRHPASSKVILDPFRNIELVTSNLLGIISSLSSLADEQASAPPELRSANQALRISLADASKATTYSSEQPSPGSDRYNRKSITGGLGLEDENAEELESQRESGNDAYSVRTSILKAGRTQVLPLRHAVTTRPSRSNSLTESFESDLSATVSFAKREAPDDLRDAMQEAGISKPK